MANTDQNTNNQNPANSGSDPNMAKPNSNLPAIEPQVKQQVTQNQAAMNASFQLDAKDAKKLPGKPWLHKVLILIPIALLLSILLLSWAYFTRGKNFRLPFFSQPVAEDSLQKYLDDLEVNAPREISLEERLESQRVLITSLAQKSDTLTLTNCRPDPLVLEVVQGEKFTVVNQDAEIRTLNIGQDYRIPAKGSTEIVAIFNLEPSPPAAYYYTCDESQNTAGYILVK